ncbi:MAG: hypothetical protein ACI80M_001423 [Gammaproteobacteria bacterium]|mgnify:CR=1 FL=1|jgi:hypothetical protein|tara:strand:+ start:188 stop:712 length:525 start_codon:yes stop_codon:yes gene_type:complete
MEHKQDATAEAGWSDPRISQFLMTATLVVGAIGYFIGFSKIISDGAEAAVSPVALISVGVVGIISMLRHSVFHRSDAIRMGWDQGRRNNFQIEVGFANLAIGLPAILAVALSWGVAVEAAFVLAYALYFAQVTVLVLMDRDDGKLNLFRVVMMFMQTGLLGYFALSALAAVFNR